MKMKIRCNGTSTKPRPAGTLPWDLNFRGLCSGPSLAAPLSTKGVCKTNEMCPPLHPTSSTFQTPFQVPGTLGFPTQAALSTLSVPVQASS